MINNKYILIFLLPEELILGVQRRTLVRHRDTYNVAVPLFTETSEIVNGREIFHLKEFCSHMKVALRRPVLW